MKTLCMIECRNSVLCVDDIECVILGIYRVRYWDWLIHFRIEAFNYCSLLKA